MIDEYRALYPHLGLAVYAYTPGGPITVEVLTADGSRFERQGRTAREALEALFGPLPAPPEDNTETQTDEDEHELDDIFS